MNIKSCADFARIDKLILLIKADQKGSDTDAPACRFRITGNHEFLLGLAFKLQPVAGTFVYVRAARSLCNNAFPSFSAGFSVERLPFSFAMSGKPQRISKRKCMAEQLLSVSQFDMGKVIAVQIENIEKIVEDWNVPLLALLEQRESRNAAFERDNLAVNDEVGYRFFQEGRHEFRIIVVKPDVVS